MSNKNNAPIIFEYEPFKERLCECASSHPTWTSTISMLLEEHSEEENLNKLVEGLIEDAHPYRKVIAEWEEISKNVATHNGIDNLIRQFEDKGLLHPSKQPLGYLYGALLTLRSYALNPHLGENKAESNKISSIRSVLESGLEETLPSAFENSFEDYKVSQDTHAQEANLQELEKKFRDELDYIAKGDETDNIFRDVNKIGDKIIPQISKRLKTIVGNERFRKDLDKALKMSEQDIKEFTYKAQFNLDKQIKAVLDDLKEEFKTMLESEIRPQLQQVTPYLSLFVDTERHLKEIREDIKNWQKQTEKFIAETFQLPKDIQESCERFREDFRCLEILDKYEPNAEIDSEEVKTLKYLFGSHGTSVFARLNRKTKDLSIPRNVERIGKYVDEIDKRYKWQNKIESETSDDRLIHTFRHADTRLEDIGNYLKLLEEAIR